MLIGRIVIRMLSMASRRGKIVYGQVGLSEGGCCAPTGSSRWFEVAAETDFASASNKHESMPSGWFW